MRYDLLPGTTNVVRFPVERRATPTLDLMREIAPDSRYIANVAEAFGLEAPEASLRDQTDQATAEHIVNAGITGVELDELLQRAVIAAVAACQAADDAAAQARSAAASSDCPKSDRNHWALQETAATLARAAAIRMVEAHLQCEEAEGVARAVDLARRGVAWTPRDPHADAAALFLFA